MRYGITKSDGSIICDPIEYNRERFTAILNRHGVNANSLPDATPSGVIECDTLRILPSNTVSSQPPYEHAYTGRLQLWAVVGDTLQRGIEWILLDVASVKTNMLAAMADIRYRKETGGVTLPDGTVIKSDRESQALVSGAYQSLSAGLITATDWKSESGWVTVTLEAFKPVAQAVATHVAKCFAAEKAVGELIAAAETVDALRAIDLQGEFDSSFSGIS